MKTLTSFFIAAFVLFTIDSFAQNNKTTFENASFTKAADGVPCVQLNWTRGVENTAYYLVERSTDGKKYKTVAVVFTSDDAQWTSYNYRDKSIAASNSTVFYRIGIVSEQKKLTYLPVAKVNTAGSEVVVAGGLSQFAEAGK